VEEVEKRRLRGKQSYGRKIKRAVHVLFFKRHRKAGVTGWELRREIGSDFKNVLQVLDEQLKPLDLKVRCVFSGAETPAKPSEEQLLKARYYIALRGTLTPREAKMCGWRIDDIAGLAITIAYIISKRGKASRAEVEKLLAEKLPGWRVEANMERYIREGYIAEDEEGMLSLDWRARAEIDQGKLVELIMGFEEGKTTPRTADSKRAPQTIG